MMIVLALSYLAFAGAIKVRRYTWLFAAGAAILVPSMFLTFSRSAGLAFLVILIVMGIAARKRLLTAALVALILVGAVGVTRIPLVNRHFSGATHPFSTGAITDRLHVWGGVLRLVSDRPAFGVGPRNFNYFDKQRYGIGVEVNYFNHAHSLYFNVLAEMGWLGAAALALWLGTIAVVGWRARRSLTTPWGRVVWMGALGCFLAITVSGIMTTTLHTEGAMAFSAVIGLLLAARVFAEGGRGDPRTVLPAEG
jgi:O-antigen ligase